MNCKITVLLLFFSFSVEAQIFRFNHVLSQDVIQNANFTLHQSVPFVVHNRTPLTQNNTQNLIKGLYDTITTTCSFTITSSRPIFIRYAGAISFESTCTPGIPINLTDGTEFYVPANTGVLVSPGKTVLVKSEENLCILHITTADPHFTSNSSFLQELKTTTIRLTAKTKGIITVSGGKIVFDPWQITSFANAQVGLNDINRNTALPLELRDNRTKVSDPTRVLKVPYKHFTISINSIPFRYRGRRILGDTVHATGTVTTAFNLALSMGHTWGISSISSRARNDYSFTVGFFAGPSSVDIKKETVDNPGDFVAGRTNPVLSYGINTIFARNGLGFLFALGFDKAYGKFGKNWIYNNRPWVGFGISAGFPR